MEEKNEKQTNRQHQPWGALGALFVSITAYLFSQIVLGIILLTTAGDDGDSAYNDVAPWASLVLTATSSALMLGVVWLFLRTKKFKIRDFGFKRPTRNNLVLAAVAYVCYFFIFLTSVLLLTAFVPAFNADEVQDVGFTGAQGWQLILAFISLVIIAPIAEELFFRGFLYRGLRRSWPVWIAAVVTSGLFALAHGQWNVGVDVFVLSLALIYVYQKTNNLWLCIGMHATKNLLAFLFLFVFVAT